MIQTINEVSSCKRCPICILGIKPKMFCNLMNILSATPKAF